MQGALDQLRDAGKHRAAQDYELTLAQVCACPGKGLRDGVRVRIQVLVDGRSDDHDDDVGEAGRGGIGSGVQVPVGQDAREHRPGSVLLKRHDPGVDQVDRRRADVADQNTRTTIGKGDGQRKADMPAATDHHDVPSWVCRIVPAR